MTIGHFRFTIKIVVVMAIIVSVLILIGHSHHALTMRFESYGWIALIIGMLAFIIGLLVAWATTVTFLDRRAIRTYRADPESRFENRQSIALSGRIRVEGEPLQSPYSGKACASYSYMVKAQRNDPGSNGTRQQLCLLGFHMLPSVLDCGSRRFPLSAFPEVDTDFRSIASGGEWGDRALKRINRAHETMERKAEPDARAALDNAKLYNHAPQAVDFFIAPTRAAGSAVSVTEDAVPVDAEVTVLGAYVARNGGLDGQRFRGMKIFAGTLDECLASLDKDWRVGVMIGLPSLGGGLALLMLAQWWPTGS